MAHRSGFHCVSRGAALTTGGWLSIWEGLQLLQGTEAPQVRPQQVENKFFTTGNPKPVFHRPIGAKAYWA